MSSENTTSQIIKPQRVEFPHVQCPEGQKWDEHGRQCIPDPNYKPSSTAKPLELKVTIPAKALQKQRKQFNCFVDSDGRYNIENVGSMRWPEFRMWKESLQKDQEVRLQFASKTVEEAHDHKEDLTIFQDAVRKQLKEQVEDTINPLITVIRQNNIELEKIARIMQAEKDRVKTTLDAIDAFIQRH